MPCLPFTSLLILVVFINLLKYTFSPQICLAGQRIVAQLREQTYKAALMQEVEFVEKGEGDVLSRLNVDSSIVGER